MENKHICEYAKETFIHVDHNKIKHNLFLLQYAAGRYKFFCIEDRNRYYDTSFETTSELKTFMKKNNIVIAGPAYKFLFEK